MAEKRKGSSQRAIVKLLRELEIYNKEHKTHLSYGKYVALMEFEKNKQRRPKDELEKSRD